MEMYCEYKLKHCWPSKVSVKSLIHSIFVTHPISEKEAFAAKSKITFCGELIRNQPSLRSISHYIMLTEKFYSSWFPSETYDGVIYLFSFYEIVFPTTSVLSHLWQCRPSKGIILLYVKYSEQRWIMLYHLLTLFIIFSGLVGTCQRPLLPKVHQSKTTGELSGILRWPLCFRPQKPMRNSFWNKWKPPMGGKAIFRK